MRQQDPNTNSDRDWVLSDQGLGQDWTLGKTARKSGLLSHLWTLNPQNELVWHVRYQMLWANWVKTNWDWILQLVFIPLIHTCATQVSGKGAVLFSRMQCQIHGNKDPVSPCVYLDSSWLTMSNAIRGSGRLYLGVCSIRTAFSSLVYRIF